MKPIIAGPCSAESEEQILKIAEFLTIKTSVKMMRAGVWKPRTRPGGFEGYAEKALQWLQKAQQQYGIKPIVEVAKPEHIESCMQYGIENVWIGARTTVNPFSVQEIAEALKGTALSVMVKNPMNPDLHLWLGAIERIEKAGISNVKAIHRGFSSHRTSQFRNPPMWEIPIELKRLYPELELYCDPSHISGTANLVPYIAQKALDMEMDGLMIEVHPTPEHALTDASQQLSFAAFEELQKHLVQNNAICSDMQLEQMRVLIDDLDEELIAILSKRMKIIQEMGDYKQANQMTILQMDRWKTMLENRLKCSEKQGINTDFSLSLWRLIHSESLRIQTKIE